MENGTPAIWANLSDRQRLVLAAVGGWVGAWAVAKCCDWAAAKWGWGPLTAVAQFIAAYLLNWTVAGILIGGVAVAFGPNAWIVVKRMKAGQWGNVIFFGFFGAVCAVVFGSIGWNAYKGWFWVPQTYDAPKSALRNADGTLRTFTSKSPVDLTHIYRNNTQLVADKLVQPEIGKWMAVTGKLQAARTTNGATIVTLSAGYEDGTRAELHFSPHWTQQLLLPKESQIYAICKILSVNSLAVTLGNCEPTSPP